MDVVYILGNGSMAEDEEIRYSVRSLEKNMLDLGDIYVVGAKPAMLPGVHHIPADDVHEFKWKNALEKTLLAAQIENISDEFLLMNDDFFLTEQFVGADWPFYALRGSNGGNCGQHSFHIHAPMRIQKEWYLKMPFDINARGHWSPRTFYANFYKAPPTFCDDFVLSTLPDAAAYDLHIKNWPCFSISNLTMLDGVFRLWLHSLFPTPSRFEA